MSAINIESYNLSKVQMKKVSKHIKTAQLSFQKWLNAKRTPAKEVKLEKAIQLLEKYYVQLNIDKLSLDQIYSLKKTNQEIETYCAKDAAKDLALLWDHYKRQIIALEAIVGGLFSTQIFTKKIIV